MRKCRILWYLQCFLHLRTVPACWSSVRTPAGMCLFACFCVSRSEQYGIYGVFACFQKTFFSGKSNPVVFTVLSTPVHCSCALCLLMFLRIKSRKAGHLSSASFFKCPVSACYFDSVGWDASPKTSLNPKPSLQDLNPQALRYCAATCVLLAQVVT